MTDDNNLMETESFSELFGQFDVEEKRLEPGRKVRASIVRIGREWIFLDLGCKSEGFIDKKEFIDESGNLSVTEGDAVEVYFLSSKNNDKLFTTRIKSGSDALPHLIEAHKSGIPVEGLVSKEVKGGFEVTVAGKVRCFCPYSQIDIRRQDDTVDYVGKQFLFKILEYKENGRNIILSHRAVLEEERREQQDKLRKTLEIGQMVHGKITAILDFGAFVDIGGLEGLIPAKEISWSRLDNISSLLAIGQEVEVEILKLDWQELRFSFSLKRAGQDPWERVEKKFPVGSTHKGTIVRLAPFGAFVELLPGVDGLLHISRIGGGRRLHHAREVLQEGEVIEIRIDEIKQDDRRISLSLADNTQAPSSKDRKGKKADDTSREGHQEYQRYKEQSTKKRPASLGTLGDLLKDKL